MKNIFVLIFLFSKTSLFAQTHNEVIWKFTNDHIGEKVGNGVCIELVKEAYKQYSGSKVEKKLGLRYAYYSFGREIPKDSVMEGDIVFFEYFNKETNKQEYSHVGIVYSVCDTNMTIASQNYNVDKLKDSKVDVAAWKDITDVDSTITQTITFYRPD
jgi:hypothetical protein